MTRRPSRIRLPQPTTPDSDVGGPPHRRQPARVRAEDERVRGVTGIGARLARGVAVAVAVAGFGVAAALAGTDSVRDKQGDTEALERKPEMDIAKVAVADEAGRRLKFKMTMHGKLEPSRSNTRPFILINTKGGSASSFEYLVLGPRVFEVQGEDYVKVGANKFVAKKSTWIYRFKPTSVGLRDGDTFGWAILTAKGKTVDLAPNGRYRDFEVDIIPPATPPG
jgi:hypothetical protein